MVSSMIGRMSGELCSRITLKTVSDLGCRDECLKFIEIALMR